MGWQVSWAGAAQGSRGMMMSTRRLRSRPSAVALDAIGSASARPSATTRANGDVVVYWDERDDHYGGNLVAKAARLPSGTGTPSLSVTTRSGVSTSMPSA